MRSELAAKTLARFALNRASEGSDRKWPGTQVPTSLELIPRVCALGPILSSPRSLSNDDDSIRAAAGAAAGAATVMKEAAAAGATAGSAAGAMAAMMLLEEAAVDPPLDPPLEPPLDPPLEPPLAKEAATAGAAAGAMAAVVLLEEAAAAGSAARSAAGSATGSTAGSVTGEGRACAQGEGQNADRSCLEKRPPRFHHQYSWCRCVPLLVHSPTSQKMSSRLLLPSHLTHEPRESWIAPPCRLNARKQYDP